MMPLWSFLTRYGLATTKAAVRRMIDGGAIRINGERASGVGQPVDVAAPVTVQIGRRPPVTFQGAL